ncbi:MAG: hypothetical protein AVDCRST_MAG79-464, partial [uncultured Thermoleophilia bacterium]
AGGLRAGCLDPAPADTRRRPPEPPGGRGSRDV